MENGRSSKFINKENIFNLIITVVGGVLVGLILLTIQEDNPSKQKTLWLWVGIIILLMVGFITIWNLIQARKVKKDSELDKEFQQEPILLKHFSREDWYDINIVQPEKLYHHQSAFIKSYGLKKGSRYIGERLFFEPSGLNTGVEIYENSKLVKTKKIIYDKDVSLYNIIFSLINMIGGLYLCSIETLYFQSRLDDYIPNNRSKLYEHLEKVFKIKFTKRTHETAQMLVEDIKWYLQGNRGLNPRVWNNFRKF